MIERINFKKQIDVHEIQATFLRKQFNCKITKMGLGTVKLV